MHQFDELRWYHDGSRPWQVICLGFFCFMEHILFSLQHLDLGIGLLIFCAYIFIDGLYVAYTYSIVKKEPVLAATMGAIMYLLLAFGIVNFVDNFLYVVPLVAGSWLGTYFVVKYEKGKIPSTV